MCVLVGSKRFLLPCRHSDLDNGFSLDVALGANIVFQGNLITLYSPNTYRYYFLILPGNRLTNQSIAVLFYSFFSNFNNDLLYNLWKRRHYLLSAMDKQEELVVWGHAEVHWVQSSL